MVPEPPQAAPAAPAERAAAPTTRQKVRIRFRKDGELRLVSHRDLMKCFERMFRRAALPVSATKGFNPRPRMVFALSLALGVIGCEEAVELELDAPLAPEAVHDALARQAPPGLTILSVRQIDLKASARPRRVCYRVPLPPPQPANLPERLNSLLAAAECWIDRTRPQSRRVNLRPYLRDLRLLPGEKKGTGLFSPSVGEKSPVPFFAPGSAATLEIDLWVSPTGAARPDEVLAALGLGYLTEAGVVLERTLLELHDETPPPDPGALPPGALPPPEEAKAGTGDRPADVTPRPTPLLPGPLSFDS